MQVSIKCQWYENEQITEKLLLDMENIITILIIIIIESTITIRYRY